MTRKEQTVLGSSGAVCHSLNHKGFLKHKGGRLGDVHAFPEVAVYSRDEVGLSDGIQEHFKQKVTQLRGWAPLVLV